MDDRTWYLALGTLAAAVFIVMLDAALVDFETPAGLFTVLGAMLGFLGARSAIKARRGEDDDRDGG